MFWQTLRDFPRSSYTHSAGHWESLPLSALCNAFTVPRPLETSTVRMGQWCIARGLYEAHPLIFRSAFIGAVHTRFSITRAWIKEYTQFFRDHYTTAHKGSSQFEHNKSKKMGCSGRSK